mmetsp:Transcript_47254/g.101160  ORF Transcript_47254/g.101160 Transcript_47254/m.101160 type:complete len:214 (-) Transcript_47254:1813-2454(-)
MAWRGQAQCTSQRPSLLRFSWPCGRVPSLCCHSGQRWAFPASQRHTQCSALSLLLPWKMPTTSSQRPLFSIASPCHMAHPPRTAENSCLPCLVASWAALSRRKPCSEGSSCEVGTSAGCVRWRHTAKLRDGLSCWLPSRATTSPRRAWTRRRTSAASRKNPRRSTPQSSRRKFKTTNQQSQSIWVARARRGQLWVRRRPPGVVVAQQQVLLPT